MIAALGAPTNRDIKGEMRCTPHSMSNNETFSWLRRYVVLFMDESRSEQCTVCMVFDSGRLAMISNLHNNEPVKPYDLKKSCYKVLEHPPYSPDLSAGNLPHFFPLKRALRFHSDDEVKKVLLDFLENQLRSFCSDNIYLLSKRWDLCYKTIVICHDFQ
ncbi:mariner Mos1 transposase [Trichonephila clavipes]|nr:mariner Mos1 transposase [Trichonephila clavipes]